MPKKGTGISLSQAHNGTHERQWFYVGSQEMGLRVSLNTLYEHYVWDWGLND